MVRVLPGNPLAAIFCILSLAAAFLGKTASQGFISGFLALIRGIKLLFTAVWHFFVSILELSLIQI